MGPNRLTPSPKEMVGDGRSDLLTTTDDNDRPSSFWARNVDLIVAAAIAAYAAAGVLMGLVIVMAAPFWLQVAAMITYVGLGCLGWLPWQRIRGIE